MQRVDPGFVEPSADVDHEAIVRLGGDPYGWHWLFKCPNCGHAVLHDFEHDYFYPEVFHLDRRVPLAGCGDTHQCPSCDHVFISDQIWQFGRAHWSYPDWLLTWDDVRRLGLDALTRKPPESDLPPPLATEARSPKAPGVSWGLQLAIALLVLLKILVFLYLALR